MAYNPNVPTTGHDASQDYVAMQQNYAQIDTSYNTDHIALESAINIGFHNKATLVERTDPSNVAGTGIIYTKSVNANSELFLRKAAGQIIELSVIKAFVVFTFTAPGTLVILDSQGVYAAGSSAAAGVVTITFGNSGAAVPLANANYALIGSVGYSGSVIPPVLSAANFQVTPLNNGTFGLVVLQS